MVDNVSISSQFAGGIRACTCKYPTICNGHPKELKAMMIKKTGPRCTSCKMDN